MHFIRPKENVIYHSKIFFIFLFENIIFIWIEVLWNNFRVLKLRGQQWLTNLSEMTKYYVFKVVLDLALLLFAYHWRFFRNSQLISSIQWRKISTANLLSSFKDTVAQKKRSATYWRPLIMIKDNKWIIYHCSEPMNQALLVHGVCLARE